MYEQMNEWTNKWTNEQTNKWMNETANEWTNKWMNICCSGHFEHTKYFVTIPSLGIITIQKES